MKPLAVFIDDHPAVVHGVIPDREFEPHVLSGRVIKRELIEAPDADARPIEGQKRGLRRVLYALPGQEWRIDAYPLLWKTSKKCGWNEGFERMEGSLLGYEDWQIDVHIATQKARKKAHDSSK